MVSRIELASKMYRAGCLEGQIPPLQAEIATKFLRAQAMFRALIKNAALVLHAFPMRRNKR